MQGGRLCSANEIFVNQIGQGTGCSLDNIFLWTGTPCDREANKFWAVKGNPAGSVPECLAPASQRGVRCCADTVAPETCAERVPRIDLCASFPCRNGGTCLGASVMRVGVVC